MHAIYTKMNVLREVPLPSVLRNGLCTRQKKMNMLLEMACLDEF